jgi:hypothetical protein
MASIGASNYFLQKVSLIKPIQFPVLLLFSPSEERVMQGSRGLPIGRFTDNTFCLGSAASFILCSVCIRPWSCIALH